MTVLVVDTSAWMELFRGTRQGVKVRDHLLDAEALFTPIVVIAEFRKRYVELCLGDARFEEDLATIKGLGEVVELMEEDAIHAGEIRALRQDKKIGLIDCILIALARRLRGKVLTLDRDFKEIEEATYIGGPSRRRD